MKNPYLPMPVTISKITFENKAKDLKTFDFTFVGKAPLASTEYVLAAGYNTTTDVDTELGRGTTNASGNITITGDVDLNKDLKSAKVWLVPASDWSVDHVSGWGQMSAFLWETGLMDYYDADII